MPVYIFIAFWYEITLYQHDSWNVSNIKPDNLKPQNEYKINQLILHIFSKTNHT